MGALSNPRFRRLLLGGAVSSFGDSALYLSLGIWAKDLTGSNAAAGAIYLAQGAAYLAAPLAGQLADRVGRRRLLIAANAVGGVAVLGLLAVHSKAQLWVMYVVALLYGAVFTIITAAGSGLVKDLLAEDDLAGANAASVTISQGLRLLSPLVGAGLYVRFGGGSLALLDAATFVVAIAMLLSVRITESVPAPSRRGPVRAELLAGASHLRRTPLLAQITLSATLAMLVLGFYESLTFAVIAALHRPPSFFAVLMSIQAGGSIAGGLAATRLVRGLGEARTLALALAVWAIASLVYVVPDLALDCAAIAMFGAAVPLYAVALATATQRQTPANIQGRVAAASGMTTNLAQTLSIALGATLVDSVGYRPLLVVVAVVVTCAAVPIFARPALAIAKPVPDVGT
jgi:MFS family permease